MIRWGERRTDRRGGGWLLLSGVAIALALSIAFRVLTGTDVLAAQANPDSISIELEERNDSEVSGVALIQRSDAESRIEVAIDGPAGQYLPYLHRGTCEAFIEGSSIPLAVVLPETPVGVTVDLTFEELVNGEFVIDLHVARGTLDSLMDPATSVACGTIQESNGSETLQPPVAGIGPIGDDQAIWATVGFTVLGLMSASAGILIRRSPRPVSEVEVNMVALERLRGLFI
jgi:hypothetical protein